MISKRYVLTAAHCVHKKTLPRRLSLTSVRLGEYDTSTGRDCIPDGANDKVCNDEPISIDIEEQIIHSGYKGDSSDQRYDIALLRLDRDVSFSAFIKPICLPPTGKLNQRLVVAGWGKTETASGSNVKLKVTVPLVDMSACYAKYAERGAYVGEGQICAGGERGKDSCRGDSGGPLMQQDRAPDGSLRWSCVGVVSFGPSPCGMQGWPGVYTKVHDYLPWIKSQLRP